MAFLICGVYNNLIIINKLYSITVGVQLTAVFSLKGLQKANFVFLMGLFLDQRQ